MPKELIVRTFPDTKGEDGATRTAQDMSVAWTPARSHDPDRFDYEGPREGSAWLRIEHVDQEFRAHRPMFQGEKPGGQWVAAEGEGRDTLYELRMNRAQINAFITTLRRARDKAFGVDA